MNIMTDTTVNTEELTTEEMWGYVPEKDRLMLEIKNIFDNFPRIKKSACRQTTKNRHNEK